jgi:hypothetical protein
MDIPSLFRVTNLASATPLICAVILAIILIISFRSRAVVFCQYLKRMTGVQLKPSEVRKVYRTSGKDGVRSMFLELIIREDLKEGPLRIPSDEVTPPEKPASPRRPSGQAQESHS